MLKKMRRHYTKPHFLPVDAEHSHVDFIFMGFEEGAFMHVSTILFIDLNEGVNHISPYFHCFGVSNLYSNSHYL